MDNIIKTRGILKLPKASEFWLETLEYVWAAFLVLDGNSVYHANAMRDYHLLEGCVISTAVLLLVQMFLRKTKFKASWLGVAVVLALYNVVYLSFRQNEMAVTDFTFTFVLGLPLLVLLFVQMHQQGRLMLLIRKIGLVVCFLAGMSLFFWLFGVMLDLIQPNSWTVISWGYANWIESYSGLHFEIQLDTTFFQDQYIYRNSGIFTEAPMFNLWLDIALAIELFLRERSSPARVSLLVVTIFTTMSVTGILFLAICLVLYLLSDVRHNGRGRAGLMLVLVALTVLPGLIVLGWFSLSLKADTDSFLMRLSDYTAGLMLWMDYPIFGSGYGNLRSLLTYMYSPNGMIGFSNSLTAVLGTGGLWMSVLFFIPMFGAVFTNWTGSRAKSRFAFCYLFLFCSTAFFFRFIAVAMLALEIVFLLGPEEHGENADAAQCVLEKR